MASSDSDDGGEDFGKKLNHAKYAKVLSDGSVDSSRLGDEDYALVRQFVQHAFPDSSQVQRELEQTLKRVSETSTISFFFQRFVSASIESSPPLMAILI